MDRPLWRMILPLVILGYAVQRGAAVALAHLSEAPGALTAAFAVQAAALVALALGIFLGRRWTILAAGAFALAALGTALVQVAVVGPALVPRAVAEVTVAALVVAGVAWLVRHEFGAAAGGEFGDRPRPSPPPPGRPRDRRRASPQGG